MDKITIIFTKNLWSIPSWLIRWTLPRSRFALALSSHCYIDTGDGGLYEALAIRGVRKLSVFSLSKRDIVVKNITFNVPDMDKAINFLNEQLGKKYDYLGALGLITFSTRKWNDTDKWFCYELAAGALQAGGLDIFNDISHITETTLLSIK